MRPTLVLLSRAAYEERLPVTRGWQPVSELHPTRSFAMPWLARAALIAVGALALAGLLYPQFRPTEIRVTPDQVSHAAIIYAVTLLAALSFPRVKPLLFALLFGSVAITVEVAQFASVLPGAAQGSDLAADLAGIAAALLPLAVIRARRVARAEG